jgi:hypothetical protein
MRTLIQSEKIKAIRLIFFAAAPGLYFIASGRKIAGSTILFIPGTLAIFGSIIEFEKDLFYYLYMDAGIILFLAIYTINTGILALNLKKVYSQPIKLIQILFGIFFLFASYYPIGSPSETLIRVYFPDDRFCHYFCRGDMVVYSVPTDPTQINTNSDLLVKNDGGSTIAFVVATPGDIFCGTGHWKHFSRDQSINCGEVLTLQGKKFRVATLDGEEGTISTVTFEEILGHNPLVVGNRFKLYNLLTSKIWEL